MIELGWVTGGSEVDRQMAMLGGHCFVGASWAFGDVVEMVGSAVDVPAMSGSAVAVPSMSGSAMENA